MSLLEATGISKRFGGLTAISEFSFTLEAGEIVGLIGPNGAGKTTLFSILAGALPASTGQVRFLGHAITQLRPYEVCALGLARTFQVTKPFLSLTVLDNVTTAALLRRPSVAAAEELADQVLTFVGLAHRRNTLCRQLGTADRKRLELARALATEPKLLLLDEVMAGLTPAETSQVVELILRVRERGVTIMLVEHVMQAVMALCDRVLVLHQGVMLASGRPREVADNPAVIEAYLGEEYRHAES